MEELDELEAHQRAYLQIFQAVLKKKDVPSEQARALLGKLKGYITARIKDPDEFLDHIPTFSRGLGVRPEQLSAFIGSNLLPALAAVKKTMRARQEAEVVGAARARQSGGGGGSKATDAQVASSIIKEIERDLGVFMENPARFKVHDMGLMKLVSLNGGQDVLSASLRESAGLPAESGGGGGEPGGASTVTGKPAAPSAGTAASGGGSAAAAKPAPGGILGGPESSIIGEILEKFGEGLHVPGRLEVAPFPKNQGSAGGAPEPSPAPGGTAPAAGVGGATSGGAKAAPASGGGNPAAASDESSIIGEILDRFEAGLQLPPGKLRAGDGMVGGGNEERLVSSIQPGAGAASREPEPEPEPEDLPPIPLTFMQYIETVKNIQQFQTSGDTDGYRQWLSGDAGLSGKAVVGLRNLDIKAKRGGPLNYDDEYYNIAAHLDVDRSQMRELHERLKRFERLQRLLNEFTGSIKQGDPSFVAAMKKIWPQVRLLFNDEWKADHMMNTLKIPLLQITDPQLKQRVVEKMKPLLAKVEELGES